MVFKGVIADFIADETRHIDLEGAFRSGKTTAALWKVYKSCIDNPGIHWLICRYSDGDTQSKLKPPWRAILRDVRVTPRWDAAAQCDTLPNGSRVYIFGLKAQDQATRYGKLRGMTLAGIYVDQAEELPEDVYQELMGRLSQSGHPHQLLLTPNPPDENHWLATRAFPETNHIRDFKYYSVPIYANAHNLPPDTIEGLERVYPPSHPKHRSAVLGKRGLNVIGKPVYGGDPERNIAPAFQRALHVRPLAFNPHLALCEAIDFGKHHPCCLWAQFTPYGQCLFLGGVMGQDLYLEDFLPVVKQLRADWFPGRCYEMTCCDPAGSHEGTGLRQNAIEVLKDHGFAPRYKDHSNTPDVRLAMIERLAGYMRKRTPNGEAFGLEANPDRWLLVSANDRRSWHFLSDGFEAGYVWDEHYVSVGSKQMRKPKKDGWYEHGQNCAEYLELNFGGAQPGLKQAEYDPARAELRALRRAQQDRLEPFRWTDRRVMSEGRAGY